MKISTPLLREKSLITFTVYIPNFLTVYANVNKNTLPKSTWYCVCLSMCTYVYDLHLLFYLTIYIEHLSMTIQSHPILCNSSIVLHSIVWRYHNSFNQSLNHGHLDYFYVSAESNIITHISAITWDNISSG